jgi:hypothetical protein
MRCRLSVSEKAPEKNGKKKHPCPLSGERHDDIEKTVLKIMVDEKKEEAIEFRKGHSVS